MQLASASEPSDLLVTGLTNFLILALRRFKRYQDKVIEENHTEGYEIPANCF